MALIKYGSLFDFSVKAKPQVAQEMRSIADINTFRELAEVTRKSKPISFDLQISPDERGLSLKAITLNRNFDGFLSNFSQNNIYILSAAWDLSDNPINYYPSSDSDLANCTINISAGQTVEFPDKGIPVFPKRKVVGGIAYKILIMESDQNVRNLGSLLSTVGDTIRRSELGFLLGLISKATGVNGASVLLISEASKRLSHSLGEILKTNSDDYVDYLEGYHPVTNWVRDFETVENNSSTIVLNRF